MSVYYDAVICVIHDAGCPPPTSETVKQVLAGSKNCPIGLTFGIFAAPQNKTLNFCIYSDRGSGKLATYHTVNWLQNNVQKFLMERTDPTGTDAYQTYSATNGPSSLGGLEAKRWSSVKMDHKPKSIDQIVQTVGKNLGPAAESYPGTDIELTKKYHKNSTTKNGSTKFIILLGLITIICFILVGIFAMARK
jgi:hypothetical protein